MSLIRVFMATAYALAIAGEFDALRQYFDLVAKVLAAGEAVITAGIPFDKPI